MGYHQIIYLGDIDHFNLFKKKYYNHELLKYVSIIYCDHRLIWYDDLGIALDYKTQLLSGILFVYQEDFLLSPSAKAFISKLFYGKENIELVYFSGLMGIYKNDKNAYTNESAFSVDLHFQEEEKKYSRFYLMEIE